MARSKTDFVDCEDLYCCKLGDHIDLLMTTKIRHGGGMAMYLGQIFVLDLHGVFSRRLWLKGERGRLAGREFGHLPLGSMGELHFPHHDFGRARNTPFDMIQIS